MASIPAWNRCVMLLAISVAAYFQTWIDIWPYWENKNATYTHGTLIAATSLWLIWRARRSLIHVEVAADLRVLPVILLFSFFWLIAARANLFIVHAMLWPALAFSILVAGAGWQAASKFAFPLAFLYFGIPIWDYLKPPLQAIASTMVGFLTSLVGIPVIVENAFIVLPNETIYIALECSGAHFLSVALAVGVLAGEIRRDNVRTRLLLLGIAAALSMVFNWMRILLIVFAYLDADLKQGLETIGHYTFGWWVFAFDLFAFYCALRWIPLSEQKDQVATRTERRTGKPESAFAYPSIVLAALVLPVSSWAAHWRTEPGVSSADTIAIPGMVGPISPDALWNPQFDGAAWEHRVAYVMEGRVIELYRNEYIEQSQGKELISQGSVLFDPTSFTIGTRRTTRLTGADETHINAVRTELVDKSRRRWLALHTYIVNDETNTNPRYVQLQTALHSLFGRPVVGVLAVMALCGSDCTTVAADLEHVLVYAYAGYGPQHRQR